MANRQNRKLTNLINRHCPHIVRLDSPSPSYKAEFQTSTPLALRCAALQGLTSNYVTTYCVCGLG